MTKNDFFRLLGEAVKYSPSVAVGRVEIPLNTFAVLRSPIELTAESLEKTIWDKGKPYFYSRKWEAFNYSANRISFEYPILVAYDLGPRITDFFSGKGQRLTNIRLDCLYPNVEKAGADVKQACKALVVNEIYDLTHAHLLQVLAYMKNCIYADVDGTHGWHNLDRLNDQVADGDVTTYTKDVNTTAIYTRRMKENNGQINGGYLDDESKDMLCGLTYTITLQESACELQDSNFNTINCC